MNICTFFGHRDTPEKIEPILRSALITFIEERGIELFYVGNHGNFDRMVKRVLRELRCAYPHIRYAVVLAYLPAEKFSFSGEQDFETIYPEGLELVPRKYAILKRNEWMLKQADHVITYIKHPSGGAAKFHDLACRKGKHVLNLAETE